MRFMVLYNVQRTPHQQLPPRRPACTSGPDNMVSLVSMM